jgi:hypothetical protein
LGKAAPEVIDAGYVTLIASAAAISCFLFGYDSAVINGAVPRMRYVKKIRGRTLEDM